MPIQSEDIKLLKSAVLADTPDGGGAMTGTALADGASNNLFPDISQTDRALGRDQFRKVFGVAQSTDSDTLLGAHAVITKPPEDSNVIATLFKTSGWGDVRADAQHIVERYLVKGSRAPVRIYDTHYEGSMQIRLYMIGAGTFPSAGECIVLVNPARIGVGDAFEQFVRVQDYSLVTQTQSINVGGEIKEVVVRIATYSIEQPLKMDIYGPPVCKVFDQDGVPPENYFAKVYSTAIADSGRFFGIKKLAANASAGDLSVVVDGGIFSPIIPSATQETPVIDAQTSSQTSMLVDGSYSTISASIGWTLLGTGRSVTVNFATPIAPNGFNCTIGGNSAEAISDDGAGGIKSSAGIVIGTIDYQSGIVSVTVPAGVDYNNTVRFTAQYKLSSLVQTEQVSTSLPITIANQGVTFINLFDPKPYPGTLKLSYVARGRWYDLQSNNAGRIFGADSSYGSGSINSSTGSVSLTLGTPPDVGSQIIASWGANTATLKPTIASLPTRLQSILDFGVNIHPAGRVLTWTDRSGDARTASVSADGVLSGDATGAFISSSKCIFIPAKMPNADGITLNYTEFATAPISTLVDHPLGAVYQLDISDGPIARGTFSVRPIYQFDEIDVFDRDGLLVGKVQDESYVTLGSINYQTGIVEFVWSYTISGINYGYQTTHPEGWNSLGSSQILGEKDVSYQFSMVLNGLHYYSANALHTAATKVIHPSWMMQIPIPATAAAVGTIAPDSVAFSIGDVYYVCSGGVLKTLDISSASYVGSVIGSVSQNGIVTIASELLPNPNNSGRENAVVWRSALVVYPSLGTDKGIFRTQSFPLKPSNFQMYGGTGLQAIGSSTGTLEGGFTGTIDYKYGIVKWQSATLINATSIRYNAVALLSLPLNPVLLGLDTARLPADGKVPIYRKGDLLLVHNSQQFALQAPIQKGVVYSLGRGNLASVRVSDAGGVMLPESLYTIDLVAAELTFTVGTDTSAFVLPWAVEHTIEDMVLCTSTDISGLLKIARPLAHDFALGTSYVSSILPFGDLFSRAYGDFAQQAMIYPWADERQGSEILPNYNGEIYPIVVNNTGAIRERWALIFTSTTAYRCVGEQSGQIGTGVTTADYAPINPATGLPYFTILAAGFGAGWSTGNVLRFNTDAAGSPFWILRTVLQGDAQAATDKFRISFRGDVNRV